MPETVAEPEAVNPAEIALLAYLVSIADDDEETAHAAQAWLKSGDTSALDGEEFSEDEGLDTETFTPYQPSEEELHPIFLNAQKRLRAAEEANYRNPLPSTAYALEQAILSLDRARASARRAIRSDFSEGEETGGEAEVFAEDAQGHEHAGKGPKGGQFVKKGAGGSNANIEQPTPEQPKETPAKQAPQKQPTTPSQPQPTSQKVAEKGTVHQSKVAAPAEAGQMSTPEEHRAAVAKALAKFSVNPKPSKQELKEAKAGLAKLGANKYRRNLVGNSVDRRKRRVALLDEFDTGVACPCVFCGIKVGEGSLEQDKIYTTAQGGRYRTANLIPSCSDCNKRRGDMPFAEAMKKVVKYDDVTT